MPNTINLRLLDNRNIIAEMNGISLAQENSYKIIAGEENATKFTIISKPEKYKNATYTVEMVNSQGYGIDETDILDDTFALPKGMAVAGYGWVQIRAYYTNEEGKEEKVPFMTLKVKVWNTIPTWKEHISEGGSGGSEIDLSAYQTKTDQALETESKEVVGAINEVNEKLIRTLETTPTETTEGYAGEIVQVSDGTSYQCTAVADGVYTWVRIIKETDGAKSGWGKDKMGVIAFYSNLHITGISAHNESGLVFPMLANASSSDIKGRASNKAITTKTLNNAVKATLTDDNKMELTTEEKQEACKVLGATKWYKHIITCSQTDDYGMPMVSQLTVLSMRADVFENDDLEFTNGEYIVMGHDVSYAYINGYLEAVVGYTYGNNSDWGGYTFMIIDELNQKTPIYNIFGITSPEPETFVDTVTEL